MHFRKTSSIFLGAALLSFVSCGPNGMDEFQFGALNKNLALQNPPQEIPEEYPPETDEVEQEEGHFKAVLWTLNSHVESNKAVGNAHLVVRDGKLTVEVKVDGAPANITHIQHIHAAERCPGRDADANEDTFIDVMEGIPFYGQILLNLDSDLTDQMTDSEFPMADEMGSYVYSQSALLEDVLTNEPLNLAGKTIVIHGVPEETELPDTVESMEDLPNHRTLPIACGEIKSAIETGGK